MSLNTYVTESAIVPPSDIPIGETIGWINAQKLHRYFMEFRGHDQSMRELEDLLHRAGLLDEVDIEDLFFFVLDYDEYGTFVIAVNTTGKSDADPSTALLSVILPHMANIEYLRPEIIASPSTTPTGGDGYVPPSGGEATTPSSEPDPSELGFSKMAYELSRALGDAALQSYDPIQFVRYLKSLDHYDLERYLSVYGYEGIGEMLDAANAEADAYANQLKELGIEYEGDSGKPENPEGTRDGSETPMTLEDYKEDISELERQIKEKYAAAQKLMAEGDKDAADVLYEDIKGLEAQIKELEKAASELRSAESHEPPPPEPTVGEYESESLIPDTEYIVTDIPLQTDVQNTSLGFSQSIEDVVAGSDNVRFDFNSSNIFAEAVEAVADGEQASVQSYSPLEGLGIVVNRPKILLASDYDLGTDQGILHPAINNMHESIDYNNVQHEHVFNFYNSKLLPEISKLTDLETAYADRLTLCLNSIQFIRTIDEFKTNFINEITSYNKYGLQILGYTNGLNATRAIRQAFYDISHLNESGGYFIYHKLRDIFETADTVGLSDESAARIVDPEFQPGYRLEAVDFDKLTPPMTTAGIFTLAAFLDQIILEGLPDLTNLFQQSYGNSAGLNDEAAAAYLLSIIMNTGFISADAMASEGNSCDYHFHPADQNYPHNPLGFSLGVTDPDTGAVITQAGYPRCLSQGPKLMVGSVRANRQIIRTNTLEESRGATAASRAQTLWFNLTKSYIINSINAQDVEDKGEEYFDPMGNIAKNLLGDASTDVSLGDTDNSKKLAQILRWPSTANTVYPFERPNMKFSGELTDSASGIEKWFDENIGNLLEERGTDFRGLDNFVESFDEIVNELERKVAVFSMEGHGQLLINEIMRALRSLFTGDLLEFHPQPGYSDKKGGGGLLFSPTDAEEQTGFQLTDPIFGPLPEDLPDKDTEAAAEDAAESTEGGAVTDGSDSAESMDAADADGTSMYSDPDPVYTDTADTVSDAVTDGVADTVEALASADDDGDAEEADDASCFVPGTIITTVDESGEKSFKVIENIVPGDTVLTYNLHTSTFEAKTVLETYSPMHDDIVEFVFSNGKSSQHTFDHPYFVKSKGWASYSPEKTILNYSAEASELKETSKIAVGDEVMLDTGTYASIVKIEVIDTGLIKTYNFAVNDNKNYFADGVLVHNKVMDGGGETAFDGYGGIDKGFQADDVEVVVTQMETHLAMRTQTFTAEQDEGTIKDDIVVQKDFAGKFAKEEPQLIQSRDHFFTKVMTLLTICQRMASGEISTGFQTLLTMGSIVGEHFEARGTQGTYTFEGQGTYQLAIKSIFGAAAAEAMLASASDQEAKAIIIHIQELIAAVCGEIEKNLAYDIGVLCNDRGLVPRSVGAYDDKTAIGILDTIFKSANGNMGMIYGDTASVGGVLSTTKRFTAHTAPVPATATTTLNLADFGLPSLGTTNPNIVLHHLQVRTEILHIIGDIATRMFDDLPKDEFETKSPIGFTPIACRFSPVHIANESMTPGFTGEFGITRRLSVFLPDFLGCIKFKLAATAEMAKMFLPVVDNLDPNEGPVRWKLTTGLWNEAGVELETSDFVNRDFVPQAAVDIVNQGASAVTAEIAASAGFGPSAASADALARGLRLYFGFLLKEEDIIPYTFVDDKEIPQFPFTIDPIRGPASGITKACVFFREDTRRLLNYLKSIVAHYKAAKDNMVSIAEDPNGADLVDRAKLHGVEATEIITYSSTRQTFLRSFLLSEESGLRTSAYTPSSNYASKRMNNNKFIEILNEALVANACLTSPTIDFFNLAGVLLGKTFSQSPEPEQEEVLLSQLADKFESRTALSSEFTDTLPQELLGDGKIITIGIPAGLTDFNAKADVLSVFERFYILEQNNNHFFTGTGQSLKPIYRVFWPSLFINRVELMEAIAKPTVASFRDLVHACNYGIVDPTTGNYTVLPYANIKERMETIISSAAGGAGLRSAEAHFPYDFNVEVIVANHVIDELLGLYLDFYAGLNTTESSFSVNLDSNLLYLDQTALDNIDMIVSFVPGLEAADQILDDDKIVPFTTFFQRQNAFSDKEQAFETYSVFASIIQSRLFSADQMSTMVLVPNIFDRTFNIFTHMGQLFFEDDTMFDFTDEFDPETLNALANDYNSQVHFKGFNT